MSYGVHAILTPVNHGFIVCLSFFAADKMVRTNDPFWNYVEDMTDGSKKCTFCWHLFAKDTSISRIKWHLSGETGHGVGICCQVPKEIQEAAFLAMHGDSKIHKSTPSSSNVNDHAISNCPQDNGIHGNLVGDAGRMQVGVQVRPYDPFWNYVEDMNDGSKMCRFCGHLFAKDTSISRIKWHLSGETGHGVGICGQVPKEVQEAAFLAMRGDNKIHKSTPSSSNVNDYTISTCPQDNGIHGNLVGDARRMQDGVQVRPNDPFWNYVEDMNDGSKMCKFCGHLFAKDTSISRIKWHLSGETGHGVGICGQVPKEVQEATFLAMHGDNKIHKSTPSSSNVNDYTISTCPQDNGIHGNLVGDARRMQVGVQVRPYDPFWNDVEDMNDGSKKCKFCGHLFAKRDDDWHLWSGARRAFSMMDNMKQECLKHSCGQVPKDQDEFKRTQCILLCKTWIWQV
uniref:BED-type domain-containing protein n=1 Tax=Salix viminalis TaxID=40686 RepID=A0A6N2N2A8_SALVM